jgi:hypothetical protein
VVLAFVVGVGLAYAYHSVADGSTSASTVGPPGAPLTPVGALTTGGDAAGAAADARTTTDPPGPPAATARDAVAQFLSAEVAQQFDASYGLLSSADRARVQSRAAWTTAHGEMAPIRAFSISDVTGGAARATATVQLDLRSRLDQVNGLVTARAVTYVAVAEDGGWRIDLADSVQEPVYPSDGLATGAVRDWAIARQACRKPDEFAGGLLGAPREADSLCHTRGPVRVGAVAPLPESDAAEPFLAAFGPDVYEWARTVPLRAPHRMDVVVAPVADQWLPIGVLRGGRP